MAKSVRTIVVTSLVENGAGGWTMDKKPTDEEIVKSLECHAHRTERKLNCCDCGYIQYQDCSQRMSCDALDLINRLQEKDETRHKVFETKCEELEISKAENERLTIRLRKAEHQLDDSMIMYNTIKSEAYKEFAERLKDKKARYNADNFYVIDYIPSKELDNLLKELVGDNNEMQSKE